MKLSSASAYRGAPLGQAASFTHYFLVLAVVSGLGGCASKGGPAPVSSVDAPPPEYTVQAGDTLYGIAATNNVSVEELAQTNGIIPPFLIRPGQRLKLQTAPAPRPPAAEVKEEEGSSMADAWSGFTGGVSGWFDGFGSGGGGASSSSDPFSDVRPSGARTAPIGAQSRPEFQSLPPGESRPPRAEPGNVWQWPVVGGSRVHRSEDNQVQGLRIRTGVGQPVYAARDGQVSFVNTFPGYGELMIIEHDKEYLSAYGFIRKPRVKEGDRVTQGMVIAEVSAENDGELHFEIRHDGKPLDPATLLPRNQ